MKIGSDDRIKEYDLANLSRDELIACLHNTSVSGNSKGPISINGSKSHSMHLDEKASSLEDEHSSSESPSNYSVESSGEKMSRVSSG